MALSLTALSAAAESGSPTQSVDSLFQNACEGAERYKETETKLRSLPPAQAIQGIVQSLRTGNAGKRWDVRKLAYESLAFHQAAATDVGREQLIRGLDDSVKDIQRISCAALDAEVVTDELNRRVNRLGDLDAPENEKTEILRSLSGWGSCAESAFPVSATLLMDVSQSHRLRAFAAIAVLNIGGAERATEVLSKLDQTGLRESIGPLATFAGETGGTFGTDDKDSRSKLRAFIRQCMRNPDREIRQLAMHALIGAYSRDEIWLGNADAGFVVNPEYREAWEYMAHNDPDEGLRAAARERLAEIERSQDERNQK